MFQIILHIPFGQFGYVEEQANIKRYASSNILQVIDVLLEEVKKYFLVPLFEAEDIKGEFERLSSSFAWYRYALNSCLFCVFKGDISRIVEESNNAVKILKELLSSKWNDKLHIEAKASFVGVIDKLNIGNLLSALEKTRLYESNKIEKISSRATGLDYCICAILYYLDELGQDYKDKAELLCKWSREFAEEYLNLLKKSGDQPEGEKFPVLKYEDLCKITGIFSIGGDALEDSEKLYSE